MKEKAIEKINNELKEEMSGKDGAISPAVAEQLKSFCSQSPEFAAAVAEKAETLKDCCEKVLENVDDFISDAEVYKRAVKRHKDFDATACPGRNFPFEEIKKGAGYVKTELTSANDIIWELMHGKLKVNITEVDRAVRALDKARQSAEYSSLYWILRKIVNG